MTISSFDSFLQSLEIPNACKLDKPVFKKLFVDNGKLNTNDKKCLKDDVKRVRWLYSLKPSTVNIGPYSDTIRDYPEVAVLQVALSKPNRIERIANFMNRSIPYPLVLFFTFENDGHTRIIVSLSDKRINQADQEKWVLNESIQSGSINLKNPSEDEIKFLASLRITELPFKDFWTFYQALMDRVVALNCSIHAGVFTIGTDKNPQNRNDRLEKLRELEMLDTQKSEIVNRLKKESQMGRRVELNIWAKNINDRILEIGSSF